MGLVPIFYLSDRLALGRRGLSSMASKQEQLQALIAPVASALGCELWGLEYLTQGKYTTLRLYIDRPETGVTLDDCEKVSRQVSAVLDVEDPIDGEYTLEVSSPGMDRALFTLDQYARYLGENVNLRLRLARDGRRKFKGTIVAVEGDEVRIAAEGKEYLLGLDVIDKANIIPRF